MFHSNFAPVVIENIDFGDLTGKAGKVLVVKDDESGVEFVDVPFASIDFGSLTGKARYVLKVTDDESEVALLAPLLNSQGSITKAISSSNTSTWSGTMIAGTAFNPSSGTGHSFAGIDNTNTLNVSSGSTKCHYTIHINNFTANSYNMFGFADKSTIASNTFGTANDWIQIHTGTAAGVHGIRIDNTSSLYYTYDNTSNTATPTSGTFIVGGVECYVTVYFDKTTNKVGIKQYNASKVLQATFEQSTPSQIYNATTLTPYLIIYTSGVNYTLQNSDAVPLSGSTPFYDLV